MSAQKAQALRALAEEVAQELESAAVGGVLTFAEFQAVLGDNWLGWIPENDGKPSDWKTDEEQYSDFCKSLESFRKHGDPNYYAFPEATP